MIRAPILTASLLLSVPLVGIDSHIAARGILLQNQNTQAQSLFNAGDYLKAAALYEHAARDAGMLRRPALRARYLGNVASCHLAVRQYRQAFDAYIEARKTAESLGDTTHIASLSSNLSTLYWAMGELDTAVEESERAIEALRRSPESAQYEAPIVIQLADLRTYQNRDDEALALFARGIAAARRRADLRNVMAGLDRLAYLHQKRREFATAEAALRESLDIRSRLRLPRDTPLRELGLLRLQQGDVRGAAVLLDQAVDAASRQPLLLRIFHSYHARARGRLAEGRLEAARSDLDTAFRYARQWRLSALPADSSRVGIESGLQSAYSLGIDIGYRLYKKTGRSEFVRETFELAEENRAASLKLLLDGPDWRGGMPGEYWQTLSQFQAAQSKLLTADTPAAQGAVRRLETALTELEARYSAAGTVETVRLVQVQRKLRPSDALLSFHVSRNEAWVWAIANSAVEMYSLPRPAELPSLISRFHGAVETGSPESAALGEALYQALFAPVARRFIEKPRWILALDQGLFEAPLAALVTGPGPRYLIEDHSLRITSAGTLSAPAGFEERFAGPFLGVGDAIYNAADPRWPAGATRPEPALPLARLAGSGREIEACARNWPRPAILLRGADAGSARLFQTAASARPAVIHLAAHVVRAGKSRSRMLLALGGNDFTGAREIAAARIPAGLVTLSGCASGQAPVLPGAGLMGLTRAWLAAGAGAVVASYWATPDDAGALFLALYRRLAAMPHPDPAAALREAQLEMLHSVPSWRASPRYWAAYFALGNY